MQLFVQKCAAVPLGVFVLALEAEVRAEINERLACFHTFCGKLLRKSVRKRGKNNVALFNNRVLVFAYHVV